MDKTHKRYIIVGIAGFGVLFVLSLLPLFLGGGDSETDSDAGVDEAEMADLAQSEEGLDSVPITNYNQVVKNLSDGERVLIESNLFATIKGNLGNGTVPVVKDAVIRDGSYQQSYDEATQVYSTGFLVDIPSLKQTYRVNDQWSPLPADESGLYDYTTLVLCPETSDLIYAPFTCIDRIKQEQGQ